MWEISLLFKSMRPKITEGQNHSFSAPFFPLVNEKHLCRRGLVLDQGLKLHFHRTGLKPTSDLCSGQANSRIEVVNRNPYSTCTKTKKQGGHFNFAMKLQEFSTYLGVFQESPEENLINFPYQLVLHN